MTEKLRNRMRRKYINNKINVCHNIGQYKYRRLFDFFCGVHRLMKDKFRTIIHQVLRIGLNVQKLEWITRSSRWDEVPWFSTPCRWRPHSSIIAKVFFDIHAGYCNVLRIFSLSYHELSFRVRDNMKTTLKITKNPTYCRHETKSYNTSYFILFNKSQDNKFIRFLWSGNLPGKHVRTMHSFLYIPVCFLE